MNTFVRPVVYVQKVKVHDSTLSFWWNANNFVKTYKFYMWKLWGLYKFKMFKNNVTIYYHDSFQLNSNEIFKSRI